MPPGNHKVRSSRQHTDTSHSPDDPIQVGSKRKRSLGANREGEPLQPPLPTASLAGSDDSMIDGGDDDEDDFDHSPALEPAADGRGGGDISPIPRTEEDREPGASQDITEAQPPPLLQAEQYRLEREIPDGTDGPMALPATKVFPIQVGPKLFRLSGASISSDAPSYFTTFFEAQLESGVDVGDIDTLYLDRDPETFRDISLHLQGYHVEPRDGSHFVRLFADAHFFSLPRLIQRLYKSDILVKVGDQDFRIPRDIFDSPGNSPNYFSLGFSAFFSTPENVFPGLNEGNLLRPPSIRPPHMPTKSSAIFRELLYMLQGYELEIRNEDHRQALLRDARYYHFKGLEQKLTPYQILYNVNRKQEEIVMRLDDLKATGISLQVIARTQAAAEATGARGRFPPLLSLESDIAYARPFVDNEALGLVFELGPTDITLTCTFDRAGNTVNLSSSAWAKMSSLYEVLRTKIIENTNVDTLDLPRSPPQAIIERNAHVVLDGRSIDWANVDQGENDLSKLWIASLPDPPEESEVETRQQEIWAVNRSQWRLQASFRRDPKPLVNVIWRAVKIDAVSSEAHWNAQRDFLSGGAGVR